MPVLLLPLLLVMELLAEISEEDGPTEVGIVPGIGLNLLASKNSSRILLDLGILGCYWELRLLPSWLILLFYVFYY